MRKTLLVLTFVLVPTTALAAPILSWDTVTTDTSGAPLGSGLEIKSYEVYRCPTNVNPCTIAGGTKIGTVPAAVPVVPRQNFDLVGQPFPSLYMVTGTNIIAQSAPSPSIKATPGDAPKNLLLQ